MDIDTLADAAKLIGTAITITSFLLSGLYFCLRLAFKHLNEGMEKQVGNMAVVMKSMSGSLEKNTEAVRELTKNMSATDKRVEVMASRELERDRRISRLENLIGA